MVEDLQGRDPRRYARYQHWDRVVAFQMLERLGEKVGEDERDHGTESERDREILDGLPVGDESRDQRAREYEESKQKRYEEGHLQSVRPDGPSARRDNVRLATLNEGGRERKTSIYPVEQLRIIDV